MRHAKSDWSTLADGDFTRPLAKRGLKNAPRMGQWLASQAFKPELLVSSPAERAKQTVLAVAEQLNTPEEKVNWDPRIYEATLHDLLAVLDDYAVQSDSILLVGHNPGLDSLVEYLSRERPVYSSSGKLMTTAAIAVLDFGDQGISTREHSAQLEMLVRPKELS